MIESYMTALRKSWGSIVSHAPEILLAMAFMISPMLTWFGPLLVGAYIWESGYGVIVAVVGTLLFYAFVTAPYMHWFTNKMESHKQTMSDTNTAGRERFRCEECGTPDGPPSHTKCPKCGGLVREYLPIESPAYVVDMDGYGARLWFASHDYEGAYQHATGQRTDDEVDDLTAEAEEQIKIIDFDGVAEVPVSDVW